MPYTETHRQHCNKTFFSLKEGNKCQTIKKPAKLNFSLSILNPPNLHIHLQSLLSSSNSTICTFLPTVLSQYLSYNYRFHLPCVEGAGCGEFIPVHIWMWTSNHHKLRHHVRILMYEIPSQHGTQIMANHSTTCNTQCRNKLLQLSQ